MIILDRAADDSIPDTGELLEFFLGSSPASQLPFITSFVEFNDLERNLSPENFHGVSNSTTVVTILEPPSDLELSRQLKSLSIYNPNATAVTVTLQLDDNGTDRIILVTSLGSGNTLQYNDGEGFRVIDPDGSILIITTENPPEVVVDDQTNPTAATLTDAYTVPAGSTFKFFVTVVNRAAVPTAFRWSLAINGAADSLEQYKAYDTAIAANDIYVSSRYKANPGDIIRVYATLATLSFGINGELRAQ